MNNAGGHMVILAGAGLGAAFLSAYMLAARQSEPAIQEAVVVTLPQRIQPPVPQPAARPPAERPQPSVGPGPMSDPAALARMLQRELKRVGCYDGEVSGVWSPASRAAMKAFTERVNASLPVDRPDPVLLALVQGHQGRACGDNCPTGEARTANGRCLPVAFIGKAEGKPAPTQGAEAEFEGGAEQGGAGPASSPRAHAGAQAASAASGFRRARAATARGRRSARAAAGSTRSRPQGGVARGAARPARGAPAAAAPPCWTWAGDARLRPQHQAVRAARAVQARSRSSLAVAQPRARGAGTVVSRCIAAGHGFTALQLVS